MPTISERLRSIDENAMYEAPATTHRTAMEAADTIDALVAALERIKRETMRCRGEQSYRDATKFAFKESNAALALASKRPGIPVLEIGE